TIQSGAITTSGTSGNVALEVGTGGTLGTIQIGNATAAPINIGTSTTALKNIQIGATGTVADTISIGSTAAGASSFKSGSSLTFTGGASSTWDIGNNTLSIQTAANGPVTFGSGAFTVPAKITDSRAGAGTGDYTFGLTGAPIADATSSQIR